MPIYADTELPSEEELTVQEINLTTAHIRASAFHQGKYCDEQGKEFMLCQKEEKDPRKCLQQGKNVTACALKFFRQVKALCREEFEQYASCVNYSSGEFKLPPCRKTQHIYDKCMLEKMNLERPTVGYFSMPRVLHTDRPKPVEEKIEFPDQPAELPSDYPTEPAKYGSRFYFLF